MTTTREHELTAHRPIHRTAKLIWTLLAVTAIVVGVTVAVLMTTGTRDHAQPVGPGNSAGNGGTTGQVTTDQCLPTRFVHPC